MQGRPSPIDPASIAPLSSFIGRESELASIEELLQSQTVRLLTLLGPGGVGKTRLALQAAEHAAHIFPGGVRFVSLAPVQNPALLESVISTALGVSHWPERPAAPPTSLPHTDERTLIVLDNLEHLLPDAAQTIANLLQSFPRLTCLVTSREIVRIGGEHRFRVSPLPLPPADMMTTPALLEYASIQLFVDRAREAGADNGSPGDLVTIARICRHLDGLPIALEMAAAWTRVLSPQALMLRLDRRLPFLVGSRDQPERFQSMRSAIAWSYELLTPQQQTIFRRTAIFVGGFTLQAAAHVAGGDEFNEADVFHSLVDLIDRSMLHSITGPDGEPRFTQLETLREFGLDELERRGERARAAERHFRWYVQVADVAIRSYRWSTIDHEWQILERGNFFSALQYSLDQLEPEPAATEMLVCALARFWMDGGSFSESLHWSLRVIERWPNPVNLPLRGLTTRHAGTAAWYQGNLQLADVWLNKALVIHRGLDAQFDCARDINYLGSLAEDLGNDALAVLRYQEAHDIFASLGHEADAALMLVNLADVAYRRNDYDTAEALQATALAIARRLKIPILLGCVLIGVEQVAAERGNLEQATDLLDECLTLYGEDVSPMRLADTLTGYARVAGLRGQLVTSIQFLGAVSSILESTGTARVEHLEQHTRATALVSAQADAAVFAAAFERGAAMPLAAMLESARQFRAALQSDARAFPDRRSMLAMLTPREREVLGLLAEGHSNRGIADVLFLQVTTVKSHIASIMGKLGVESRTAAVALFLRDGPRTDQGMSDEPV